MLSFENHLWNPTDQEWKDEWENGLDPDGNRALFQTAISTLYSWQSFLSRPLSCMDECVIVKATIFLPTERAFCYRHFYQGLNPKAILRSAMLRDSDENCKRQVNVKTSWCDWQSSCKQFLPWEAVRKRSTHKGVIRNVLSPSGTQTPQVTLLHLLHLVHTDRWNSTLCSTGNHSNILTSSTNAPFELDTALAQGPLLPQNLWTDHHWYVISYRWGNKHSYER